MIGEHARVACWKALEAIRQTLRPVLLSIRIPEDSIALFALEFKLSELFHIHSFACLVLFLALDARLVADEPLRDALFAEQLLATQALLGVVDHRAADVTD